MTYYNDDFFCRRTFSLIQKGDGNNACILSIKIIIKTPQKKQQQKLN